MANAGRKRKTAPAKAIADALAVEAFSEPYARSYGDWTYDALQSAEMYADGGDLSMAADVCDALVGDEAVQGALSQRLRALDACPLSFDKGRGVSSGRAVNALEAGEDWDDILPSAEYAQLRTWGLLLGVGLARLPWRKKGGNTDRIVAPIEVWSPRALRYDWQDRRWYARSQDGTERLVTPGDGEWVLYTPYGRNRPWKYGLWRGLMRWWLLKNFAIQDWGVSSGVNTVRVATSTGTTGAVVPGSSAGNTASAPVSDRQIRKQLADDLKSMGRNGNIVLPRGFNLALLENNATSYKSFEAQTQAADDGFAVGIVGQNMTSDGDGATYASAKVGEGVRLDFVRADADADASIVHDQVLRPWALYNTGDPDAAPWPVRKVGPPEDLKASGEALLALGQGIAAVNGAIVHHGVQVDIDAMVKRYDVPTIPCTPEQAATILTNALPGQFAEPKAPGGEDGGETAPDEGDDPPAGAPAPKPGKTPPKGAAKGTTK